MALTILSVAIVGIGVLTWNAFQRVEASLEDLHRQTLSQVAQAIDLSKRASDLATSAPYLLNQRSNFLIEQEGKKLISILETVRKEWPEQSVSDPKRKAIFPLTLEMERGIEDLVSASQSLDQIQSKIRLRSAVLSTLREEAVRQISEPTKADFEKLVWWTLQSMNAHAINAAYANNLIGVGEEQRQFQRQSLRAVDAKLSQSQIRYFDEVHRQVAGREGVFELRRKELGIVLSAQNALFRIRRDANLVNQLAAEFAQETENFLNVQRNASTTTIQLTRVSVAGIGLLGLIAALLAALFVSRYVAFNIGRVSEAMVRLAKGDRTIELPRQLGGDDEIADLFRSFRSFRANALRLDRSNKQLDQRNALFEKVFANIQVGIAITDSSGKLTASNPSFANILSLGASQNISDTFADWLKQNGFGPSSQAAKLNREFRGHVQLTSEDGQILEVRASRLPDEGRVWLIADVTESHNISIRLEQIDRIETLGKLAGDTAHDFGNILSTIRTHTHLLGSVDADATASNVAAIENAVEFGASLTDRLLAFARKQPLLPEVVDLNSLIEGMIELVEISLKPDVEMEVVYSKEALYVLVDPGQLESAILNLVLNANNAIEGEGAITIKLFRSSEGTADIHVIDTGIGMREKDRQRAIEPFFTTRAGEGGTGLGLSIVYGFINQTGGAFEMESSLGKGTTVKISLPITNKHHFEKLQSGKTALVVDDNHIERDATSATLKKLGFDTVACSSAREARSLFESQRFDTVVSDFDLGNGQNGIELLEHISSLDDETRLILISGKSLSDTYLPKGVRFMNKPASSEAIMNVI